MAVASHHRGLFVTVVVALFVAAIGVGVMALTTNDTEDSAQEDLSSGAPFGSFAGSDSRTYIRVDLWQNSPYGDRPDSPPFTITPDYSRAQCVKTDATPPIKAPAHGKIVRYRLGVTTEGSVVTACGYADSRMVWRISFGDLSQTVELNSFGLVHPVSADCGPRTAGFVCTEGGSLSQAPGIDEGPTVSVVCDCG